MNARRALICLALLATVTACGDTGEPGSPDAAVVADAAVIGDASNPCDNPCGELCCAEGQVCKDGACQEPCVAETDAELCTAASRVCGAFSATDRCGAQRTVDGCGSCPEGQSCDATSGACVVDCVPEDDATMCTRLSAVCGELVAQDNCDAERTIASCGDCGQNEACGDDHACHSVCWSDARLCQELGAACGSATGTDNCGAQRTVECGGCTEPAFCNTQNQCVTCQPETDAVFCAQRLKDCGTVSGVDGCQQQRSVDCGSCSTPAECLVNSTCGDPAAAPVNDGCTGVEQIFLDSTGHGQTRGDNTHAASAGTSLDCLGTGPDVVYSFTIPDVRNVQLTLTPAVIAAQYWVLSVRPSCEDKNTEIVCDDRSNSPVSLTLRALPAGTYFVWVDAYGSVTGQFTLDVQASVPPPPPANDACNGEAMVFNGDLATASGNTLAAFDNYDGTCAASTDTDLVYSFELQSDSSVQVSAVAKASSPGFSPIVYLRSSCGSTDPADEKGCQQARSGTAPPACLSRACRPAPTS